MQTSPTVRVPFCPVQSLSHQLLAWRKQLMPHAWLHTSDLTGIDLFLFLALAIIGGILGALFNHIVEHLNHLRAHHVNRSALLRSLEVLVSGRFCADPCVGAAAVLTGTSPMYVARALAMKMRGARPAGRGRCSCWSPAPSPSSCPMPSIASPRRASS